MFRQWRTSAGLKAARARYSLDVLPNGQVLIAGGYNGVGVIDGVELFSESGGTSRHVNATCFLSSLF